MAVCKRQGIFQNYQVNYMTTCTQHKESKSGYLPAGDVRFEGVSSAGHCIKETFPDTDAAGAITVRVREYSLD